MIAASLTFEKWTICNVGLSSADLSELDLEAAFEVLVSRCEEARRRGASDPLMSLSPKGAGGNSRACTREMLMQLGYSRGQLRIIHRLMGGSPSGWPGLLRIFAEDRDLTAWERGYVRRQVRAFRTLGPTGVERRELAASRARRDHRIAE
ncbi:hypothetical protein [Intrasporangium calvum]|uniref:Uncharacterized protein n=1 Tax=Intrasporangium calvum (strain ATCC 23552 / DSM 43043 / JCM 3097 / NBRC 12989 / NCIMB 10167 / NRRL B-3866 / 7 KIP) TaxID=710696 RepID=E6SCI5_INTC7|nr:hypothetical protein [Intrasporangium calvum]ADU49589.1 hypothetical protein Intca_3103 [Intrasporangium calvum DSM 43043]